jgi:hypothetical protein
LMWEFRREPKTLTEQEQQQLDKLFKKLPHWRP